MQHARAFALCIYSTIQNYVCHILFLYFLYLLLQGYFPTFAVHLWSLLRLLRYGSLNFNQLAIVTYFIHYYLYLLSAFCGLC